jgi:galactokinase
MTIRAAALFRDHFGDATGAVVAQAPGRVNLLGEHTGFNDGFVLASTIDQHVEVVIRQRPDRQVRIAAADLGERRDNDLDKPIDYAVSGWLPFVMGVIHELSQRGRIELGADVVFRGTMRAVETGSWISSSQASVDRTTPSSSTVAAWTPATCQCRSRATVW